MLFVLLLAFRGGGGGTFVAHAPARKGTGY